MKFFVYIVLLFFGISISVFANDSFNLSYGVLKIVRDSSFELTADYKKTNFYFFQIYNLSDNPIKVKLTRKIIKTNPETSAGYCFGPYCWIGDTTLCIEIPPHSADSSFEVYYSPYGDASESIHQYTFIDCNSDSVAFSFILKMKSNITSVANLPANNFEAIFVIDNTIILDNSINYENFTSYEIWNLNGVLLAGDKLISNNTISLEQFDNGLYFLVLKGIRRTKVYKMIK